MRTENCHIVRKLCGAVITVLKDIGVDILLEESSEPDPPFDYDGLDFLATTVLMGMEHWFSRLPCEEWTVQPWYEICCEFLRLLRGQVFLNNHSLETEFLQATG
jgi:hypothetical protein